MEPTVTVEHDEHGRLPQAADQSHYLYWLSRRLYVIVVPIVNVVGLAGNTLMLTVMRRPSQKGSPVSVFMSALAVSDSAVLVLDFLNNWLVFAVSYHLVDTSLAACVGHTFVFTVAYTYSAWLVVCVSVERLIVIWWPLRAKNICTVRGATRVVCVLPVVCALLNSFNLFIWHLDEHGICNLNDRYAYFNRNVQAWLTALFYSYLPLSILIVSNVCIIVKLMQAKLSRESLGAERLETVRITITVVLVCLLFVILTIPVTLFYAIVFNLEQFRSRAPQVELARTIILIFGLCNYAINFFLYVLTSGRFRRELGELVGWPCGSVNGWGREGREGRVDMAGHFERAGSRAVYHLPEILATHM